MDGVVDTGVQRMPATESLTIGSVDNGINLESCDVPLPEFSYIFHHDFVGQLCLQFSILCGKKFVAQRLRLPDVA